MSIRPVKRVIQAQPHIEGAGVKLRRAFGFGDTTEFDPFLLLDDFRNENPDDYLAGFPWHPHRGIETITYVLAGNVDHRDSLGNRGSPAAGDVEWTMFVTQRGTTINGNLVTEGGEFPVSGSVTGKAFTMTFTRPYGGEMVKFIFKGTVDGESLTGTAKMNNDPEVPLKGERTEK